MPQPRTRCGRTTLLLTLAGGWLLLPGVRPDRAAANRVSGPDARSPSLRVPAGFVVERVAGPSLVTFPMMGCFDERGRLFLAEAAGKNLAFPDLARQTPNFIRLLEAADGDGRFQRGHVFADRLTFPMGVRWHDGALYTTAAPYLWRLEDTRGKGVADRRRKLVGKFWSSGNGADIHGPFLGPDGRLYWTDGRHGHEIRRPDGEVMKGLAARVFRCRPDGGDVEVVCGGGMDDPVGIAFTAEGEPLVTVDILIGQPRRIDAIIYAIEGGVYPYHPSYKEFKQTGGLLPPVADLGWVAPAGLTRYRGSAFGAAYRDNLFSAQFNRHRVQRHVLERDGAAFRVRTEDFLVSDDPDFHPTDVLEDADGSLLVIDTGGWFRIGCPTSQIAKPEVKGGIFRVRRKAAPRVGDPRGLRLAWDRLTSRELARLLDDPRFAVRDRAVHLLAERGAVRLGEMLGPRPSARARRNAVWALTRMEGKEARAAVRIFLGDKDLSVRLSAAHSAGLNRDAGAADRLTELVARATEHPAVRRAAATALGRIKRAAVPALFEGLRRGGDRFLEHALIFALIQIADRDGTVKGLRDPSPVVRRAALIALDQMDGGNLTRDRVTPLLNTDDPALQQTALEIITTRPGWARETLSLLRRWLAAKDLDPARQESLRGALLAFGKDPAVQDLVARTLHADATPTATRVLLLEAMARAPLDRLPRSWVRELARCLRDRDENVLRQAVATIRAAGVKDFDRQLLALAKDPARPADVRVAALGAAVPRLDRLEPAAFDLLEKRLRPDLSPLERLAAAEVLGNAKLEDAQLAALTGAVAAAGVLELPHLLAAYERSRSGAVGKKLVTALGKSPGLGSLTGDSLRRALRQYPNEVQEAARPLLKRLDHDTGRQKARLAELKPLLTGGDARRGREVFFGTRAACSACHTVNAVGGRVGPDLSKIGGIRSGEDLLESVVFPSASFVRGYEPYVIETRDGKLHSGVIARETAEAVYLRTAERAEVRIPRSAVESISRGKVSIMPQGLDAQLSRPEFRDLMAFLRSLK